LGVERNFRTGEASRSTSAQANPGAIALDTGKGRALEQNSRQIEIFCSTPLAAQRAQALPKQMFKGKAD
jgi:hypothetical protein